MYDRDMKPLKSVVEDDVANAISLYFLPVRALLSAMQDAFAGASREARENAQARLRRERKEARPSEPHKAD
jgi:hypothetical protein